MQIDKTDLTRLIELEAKCSQLAEENLDLTVDLEKLTIKYHELYGKAAGYFNIIMEIMTRDS